eukprot:4441252-Amphidinium_carterae.2
MLCRHGLLASGTHTLHCSCVVMLLSDIFFGIIHINHWVACNLTVIAVWAYNAEFNATHREMKNGMVSPMAVHSSACHFAEHQGQNRVK